MKRVIDISQSYFEMLKYDVEHGGDYVPVKMIAESTPLEDELDGLQHHMAELLEREIKKHAENKDRMHWCGFVLDFGTMKIEVEP